MPTLTVTDLAVERLGEVLKEHETASEEGLRLFQKGGGCGCSGPSFGMGIDSARDGDAVTTVHGIRFIIDAQSADALEGAEIDYVDDVMRQGFTIEAPNAAASGGGCGCK